MELPVRMRAQRLHRRIGRGERLVERDQHRALHLRNVQMDAAAVKPVAEQRLAHVADAIAHADAKAEVPVLRRRQSRVEAAQFLRHAPRHHNAASRQLDDLAIET